MKWLDAILKGLDVAGKLLARGRPIKRRKIEQPPDLDIPKDDDTQPWRG